jgi:hypothetical protein
MEARHPSENDKSAKPTLTVTVTESTSLCAGVRGSAGSSNTRYCLHKGKESVRCGAKTRPHEEHFGEPAEASRKDVSERHDRQARGSGQSPNTQTECQRRKCTDLSTRKKLET